jgi:hypothetical protein
LDFWVEYPNPIIDTNAKTITLLDGGEKKMTGVTTEFVARCIGAIIAMPEESTNNQRIRIAEVEYTGKALLQTFEKVTNEKWTVFDRSTDEILNGAVEAGGEGDMRGFYMGNIIKLNFDGEGPGYFEEGMKWLDGAVKRQSLKEIVERSISRLNW